MKKLSFILIALLSLNACSRTELPMFDDSMQNLSLSLPTQQLGNLKQRAANPDETAAWRNWLAKYGKTFRARRMYEIHESQLPRWCISFDNHQNGETVFCRYGGSYDKSGRIDYGLEVLSNDNEALAAADKLIENSNK